MRYLARLLWRIRGPRLVEVHVYDKHGAAAPSFRGILIGRWNGHYHLDRPELLEAVQRTHPFPPGDSISIPADTVLFIQHVAKGVR